MLRRLRIYFVGFGLGLIMVYILFSGDDRDLDKWVPGQRILEEMRADSTLQNGERTLCLYDCHAMDSALIYHLWHESKVKSLRPGGDPYIYELDAKHQGRHLSAQLTKMETGYELNSLKSVDLPKACTCP